jgi:DNA mismatch repair protein MSH4
MFTLKKSELEGELPRGFVNVTMQKGRWLFSCLDLVSFWDLCQRVGQC